MSSEIFLHFLHMGCLRESSSWKLAFLISGFHCWDPVHRQGYREAAGADAWRSFRGTNVHTISWTGRHSRWCPACCTILGESLVQFQLTVKVKKVRDYTMRQTKDWQAGPNMCFSIRVFFSICSVPPPLSSWYRSWMKKTRFVHASKCQRCQGFDKQSNCSL